MFSDKQKEAYSAVKAPDELRERILASAEETKKDNTVLFKTQFSRILAAAACIVLVTVAAFYAFNGNGIDINVNGASVAETQVLRWLKLITVLRLQELREMPKSEFRLILRVMLLSRLTAEALTLSAKNPVLPNILQKRALRSFGKVTE